MTSKNLFIVAMHRSGTSLAANWFHRCGLHMGHQLIGATFSNVFGHFEDLDFVEFHEKLLRFNKNTLYAKMDEPLVYDDYFLARAKSLIFLRNQLSSQWGVKQPRATLFLDMWRAANPEGHYFVPYRNYKEVVSSLYNREFKKIEVRNPDNPTKVNELQAAYLEQKAAKCKDYLSMWIRHNQDILNHLPHIPSDNYLVVSVADLATKDQQIFEVLTNKWGFDLTYVPIKELYSPTSFHKQLELHLDPKLEALAKSIELQLKEVSLQSF